MSLQDPAERTNAAFRSLVRTLDAHPDQAGLVERLAVGHEPDDRGWCRHPVHTLAEHPETHPCNTVRLVSLIRSARSPQPQLD
jgi:hypothetical protein